MRLMRKFLILLASVLLLVACDGIDQDSTDSGISLRLTTVSTPTLIPSLPTSTMAAEAAIEAEDVVDSPDRPTVNPTATVAPPATATPLPAQMIAIAEEGSDIGDFDLSVEQYENALQSSDLSSDQLEEALFGLGKAVLTNGQNGEAIDAFTEFLAISTPESESAEEDNAGPENEPGRGEAFFYLGQAYESENDCTNAIEAYRSYLESSPDLVAYVMPRIAAFKRAFSVPLNSGLKPAPSSRIADMRPLISMAPVVGVSVPATNCRKVDFPDPFFPMMPRVSPWFISISTSLSAQNSSYNFFLCLYNACASRCTGRA